MAGVEARTLKERQAEATRAALIKAARRLFAKNGYSGVSVEDIVARAKMTRGALYHHFEDKADLFRAVVETVAADVAERVVAAADADPRSERALEIGAQALLDVSRAQDVQRILLIDGPAVLGFDAWREIDARYALGLVRLALEAAMDTGYIERQPVDVLGPMVLAALNEASLLVARANDAEKARADVGAVVARLISGLRPRPSR